MAREVFSAREGGGNPVNAVSARDKWTRNKSEFASTFRRRDGWDTDTATEVVGDWFTAWKKSGDVMVNVMGEDKGGYSVVAFSSDMQTELKTDTAKTIKEAKRKADEMVENVFDRNEMRIFEITTSDGRTQRYRAQNFDQVIDRFSTSYREYNGSYNGMPDIRRVNEIKIK